MSDVRRPTFEILCLMSDVHCPMYDVRRPMPEFWCPVSDLNVRCAVSNVRTKNKTKNWTKIKTRNWKKNGQKKGQEIDKNWDEKSDKRSNKKEEKRSDKKMGRENRTLHGRLGIRILSSSAESISYEWAKREKIKFVSPSGHEMFLYFIDTDEIPT